MFPERAPATRRRQFRRRPESRHLRQQACNSSDEVRDWSCQIGGHAMPIVTYYVALPFTRPGEGGPSPGQPRAATAPAHQSDPRLGWSRYLGDVERRCEGGEEPCRRSDHREGLLSKQWASLPLQRPVAALRLLKLRSTSLRIRRN